MGVKTKGADLVVGSHPPHILRRPPACLLQLLIRKNQKNQHLLSFCRFVCPTRVFNTRRMQKHIKRCHSADLLLVDLCWEALQTTKDQFGRSMSPAPRRGVGGVTAPRTVLPTGGVSFPRSENYRFLTFRLIFLVS